MNDWTDDDQDDYEKIEQLKRSGHTYHCAYRLVFGDGECECQLKNLPPPGPISREIVNFQNAMNRKDLNHE